MRRTPLRVGVIAIAVALLGSACSSDARRTERVEEASVTVLPNRMAGEIVVNVTFTSEGIDPEYVFVPAGYPVRLVLRNRTEFEHHFRVEGLLATDVRWMVFPEIDTYDIDSMSTSELMAIDPLLTTTSDEAELEHLLHHLMPTLSPTKEASRSGIKPIPGEVHGYTNRGEFDIVNFIPLQTGRYLAHDVLTDWTSTVVVFLPPDAVEAGL